MLKIYLSILTLIISFTINSQTLRVSTDGHRLVNKDGSVFFYMADTGWELFHELGEKDAERYLTNRKGKGFNVIQAVILAENEGLTRPNANGDLPFKDLESLDPNEAYFKHVDWIIKKAQNLGLYMAVLPAWGQYWNKRWGSQPVIFDTPEKAKRFYKFIAARYKDQPNIIWVLGGDRSPDTDAQREICDAMAEGIKSEDQDKHLVTFHTGGGSSADFFHKEDWLDFNMILTGHQASVSATIYKRTKDIYDKLPSKPILNGEPEYEDIPISFNLDIGRFNSFDIRQSAYWSVLAGAAGHAYGHNSIWQMWHKGIDGFHTTCPWWYAMDFPGATQMGYMRRLFESRPFLKMIPDQEILEDVYGQNKALIKAARGTDGSFVIVYTPSGNPIHLKLEKIEADTMNGYWYNPREGLSQKIEPFTNTKKTKTFVPPSSGVMTDWILILDDKSKNYSDPVTIILK